MAAIRESFEVAGAEAAGRLSDTRFGAIAPSAKGALGLSGHFARVLERLGLDRERLQALNASMRDLISASQAASDG